ncbi:cystatin-like protein [Salminus brasiliensis]|uniref:cystatin-like protein n=1 Tax=Salminus brasiliensis TaxID=930266 RepID=UPI003B8370A2
MGAALKLLLLVLAVILQLSTQEWNNYRSLPEDCRTHIDKALVDANNKFGGPYHVAFESFVSEPTISSNNWYVNVRLVVTDCRKDRTKPFGHRDECVQQKPKTPWIDCLMCKLANGTAFMDCAKQMDVKERHDRKLCLQDYHNGGTSLLFQKGGNIKQKVGCIGCV